MLALDRVCHPIRAFVNPKVPQCSTQVRVQALSVDLLFRVRRIFLSETCEINIHFFGNLKTMPGVFVPERLNGTRSGSFRGIAP